MITAASPATTLAALRRLLLGLLAFGLVGTATDLLLIGHVEDAWQAIPLAAIALALVVTTLLALTGPATGRAARKIHSLSFPWWSIRHCRRARELLSSSRFKT